MPADCETHNDCDWISICSSELGSAGTFTPSTLIFKKDL